MNPFIHLLGSSLIQWMIARINGRENKIGTVAWPRRRGSPRRRGATPKCSRNLSGGVSSPPRHMDLRLGGALRLGVVSC